MNTRYVDRITEIVDTLKTEAVKIIDEINHKKRILPITRKLVSEVTNLKISLNGSQLGSTSKIEARPDWSSIIESIIDEKLVKNGFLGSVVDVVAHETSLPKKFENAKNQTEFWLENFFKIILEQELDAIYSKTSPNSTAHYVSRLVMELNEIPIISDCKMELSGVFVSSSDAILKNFTIRSPKPEDFASEKIHRENRSTHLPDCIIEFKFDNTNNAGWLFGSKIMDVIRLFRLSSVSYVSFVAQSHSLIWPSHGGSFFPLNFIGPKYKYELKNEDIIDFHKFSEFFIEVLNNQDKNEKDMLGFKMALERYRNSTLDPVDDGRNIMTAVIGLEALYTEKHEVGEIKYRLALRVAKFLSFFGMDAKDVRNYVEKAYGYRNTIGHGSNIDLKDQADVSQTLKMTIDILRMSVIVFGVMLLELNKKQIVFGIDDAMLNSDTKLEEMIKKIKNSIPQSVLKIQ